MCPVCSILPPPPHPPVFHQVLILKVVKALCFDTLLEVFILNGLHCTKIVQKVEDLLRVAIREGLGPAVDNGIGYKKKSGSKAPALQGA